MKNILTTAITLIGIGFGSMASAEIVQTENYYTDTNTGLEIIKTKGNKYSTIESLVNSGYYDNNIGTGGGWRLGTTEEALAIVNGMFEGGATVVEGRSVDNDPLKPLLDMLGRNKYSSYWNGGQTYLSIITKNDINPEAGAYVNTMMWYIKGEGARNGGQNVTFTQGLAPLSAVEQRVDYYAPLVVRGSISNVSVPATLGLSLVLMGAAGFRKRA